MLVKEDFEAATQAAQSQGEDKPEVQLALAKIAHAQGNKDDARAGATSALEMFAAAGAAKGEAVALHTLARINLDAYDYDEAETMAKQAVAKFQAAKSRQGEAAAGNTLAKVYFIKGRPEDAIDEVDNSIKKFAAASDKIGEAAALITKATIQLFKGSLEDADKFAKQAIVLLKQVTKPSSQVREADALFLTAAAALPMRDEITAVKAAKAAYAIHQEYIGGKKGMAVATRAFAFCSLAAGQLVEAGTLMGEAIGLAEQLGESHIKATVFGTGAVVFRVLLWAVKTQRGQPLAAGKLPPNFVLPAIGAKGDGQLKDPEDYANEALSMGTQARDLYLEAGDAVAASLAKVEIAQLHAIRGTCQEGLDSAHSALEDFEGSGEVAGQAIAHLTLAELHYEMGKVEEAIGAAMKAQELFKQCGGARDGSEAANELVKLLGETYKTLQAREEWYTLETLEYRGPDHVEGAVSPVTYAKLIGRQFRVPDSPVEIAFDMPSMEWMGITLGVNMPFLRPDGHNLPKGSVVPPKPGEKSSPEGGGLAMAKTELGSMVRPLPSGTIMTMPKAATQKPQVVGKDALGGRLPDIPEELHTAMLDFAKKGGIPITSSDTRSKYCRKRPTFYGPEDWKLAVRFGYVHPELAAPKGWRWQKQGTGFKLTEA